MLIDLYSNKLYTTLLKIYNWMLRYEFTRWICQVLLGTGAIYFLHFVLNCWSRIHPSKEMKNEKQLFLEHAKELKEVYDSLEDDRSRFVFETLLKYRVEHNWSDLKKSRLGDTLKNQYIVPELPFSDHEIIVDCGAFTGDTAKFFNKNIPGCKVIAIEPDEINFKRLQKRKIEGLEMIHCGVWSEDTTLYFADKGGGTGSGSVATSGSIKLEVRALDSLPECQSATYIKMDVEGAEMRALKGAEKIIKKNKPKLAICLYHQPQDYYEIPLYVKKLNPDYKLFIHQHCSYRPYETVLYAI